LRRKNKEGQQQLSLSFSPIFTTTNSFILYTGPIRYLVIFPAAAILTAAIAALISAGPHPVRRPPRHHHQIKMWYCEK